MDALWESCNVTHLHQEMVGGLRDLLKGRRSMDLHMMMALLCVRPTK